MRKYLCLLLVLILIFSLTACSSAIEDGNITNSGDNVLNIYNWGEYIADGIIESFEEETGIKVNYKTFETNEQMYSVLKAGGADYDLIIPSDYMVSRLINEGMLEELNFDNIPNLTNIDEKYFNPSYDPEGKYSVVYTAGTVGIIYNSSIITDEITSWDALFNPKYSGEILMFDNSRDAMGIALKYLGYSLNTTDVDELNEAYELLQSQKSIVQAYVMDQIFDKLESGEAAIGPYYAGDYLSMVENNEDLVFVFPEEGTNWFMDSMCIPKGAKNKENAEAFINYMCEVEISAMNMDEIWYTSPVVGAIDMLEFEDYAIEILEPNEDIISKSEIYINLPTDILALYDELWLKLKAN